VAARTSAPSTAVADPPGSPDTVDQEILSTVRATYPTVMTASRTVSQRCNFMITSKPSIPAAMIATATTQNAITLVAVPAVQPSAVKTVAVASVASATSTVSQPTSSSQLTAVGRTFPRTPKAARDSTIVGADPRWPASQTKPTSKKLSTMPATPARVACQKLTPKPSRNEP
jgi:hypothetical protein